MAEPIEHRELVDKLDRGALVLLDAQAPGWFERGHLPGAHRLDWDDMVASARAVVSDQDAEIAVYCWNTTCTGSEIVAAELERAGFSKVRRYIGGKEDSVAHGGQLV